MDRGMVSADNIEWLHEGKRLYILGASRSEIKKWDKELADKNNWQKVRAGVEVKICQGPDGSDIFLLCRSKDRATKEKAMHERFCKRIEDGLESMRRRINKSRKPLERGSLEGEVGRLLGRNSRGAGRYKVEIVDDVAAAAGVCLNWSARTQWDQWAQHAEGTYILRTNITYWTPEALWIAYVQLTQAEAAFRIHKSDLSMRPIWHHKADRIKAHILVCFLSYVLWKTLETWQSQAGLGNSPRTIIEELSRIQCADVVLPLAQDSQRELRLRCVIRPDKAQAALLDRLGLTLPQRLRPPPPMHEM